MKIEKRDGKRERSIITAIITNNVVCGRIASVWDGKLFSSPWANKLCQWCIDHYKKYSKAPGRGIQSIFEDWAAESETDDSTASIMEDFLYTLSDEYVSRKREVVPERTLDIAGEYFKMVRLRRLKENLERDISAGKLEKASSRVTDFCHVEVGVGAGIDLLQDKEAVMSTFRTELVKPVMKYPGALGSFFGSSFCRDSFNCFCGPQKSGKTWWLLDVASRAIDQRCRVAFFQIGDLSEQQMYERFLVRFAAHPVISPTDRWPCILRIPEKMHRDKTEDLAVVEYDTAEFEHALTSDLAWKACQRIRKTKLRSQDSFLKISCHPNFSVSVLDIKSILESWAIQGWCPDMIVVDYADLFRPVDKREDSRVQVNNTWMYLRALAMQTRSAVVTATPTNKDGFAKRWLDMTNFSEDNRKLSHVSSMFGINVSQEEKDREMCRLNYMVRRRGLPNKKVWCAGALGIANPAILSCH